MLWRLRASVSLQNFGQKKPVSLTIMCVFNFRMKSTKPGHRSKRRKEADDAGDATETGAVMLPFPLEEGDRVSVWSFLVEGKRQAESSHLNEKLSFE